MKKEEWYIFVDTLRSSNGYTQKKYSKSTMRHSWYKNSLQDKSEHSTQNV